MPVVDESQQARQTYGNAPGWSSREGVASKDGPLPGARVSAPPADPVESDAAAESSPAPVVPQEPAPEPAPPQEPAAEPVVSPAEPVPFHQHPRWQEVQREKQEALQRAQQAEAMARMALEQLRQVPQAPPPPQEDLWKGLVDHPDPQTALFYQQQRRLFQAEAQRATAQQTQGLLQAAEALRAHQAAIDTKLFRQENPTIKPGSQEEAEVAGYVSQGYDLETAKEKTFFKRLEAENRALKDRLALTPQKRQAAGSEPGAGIPQTAGGPQRRGTTEDHAAEVLDKGGSPLDAAKAFFGFKR